MLTEINKSGATTKRRASVESNAVKYLKTCGTVYSKLPISLLSYIDNICCLQTYSEKSFNLCFHELKMFFRTLRPRYTGQLF